MEKKKINILRLVAISCVMCAVTAAVFGISDILFERLAHSIGESGDTTKNALWLINNAQNVVPLPIIAAFMGLLYFKGDCYREKKLTVLILSGFVFFVLLPYFVYHNTAVNVTAFEALGEKIVWFLTQAIALTVLFIYYSDRENKCKEEENES